MQEESAIAFVSKALSPKNLGLSTYEREMLEIVFIVQKWRPYLLGDSSRYALIISGLSIC